MKITYLNLSSELIGTKVISRESQTILTEGSSYSPKNVLEFVLQLTQSILGLLAIVTRTDRKQISVIDFLRFLTGSLPEIFPSKLI